jgi:hypothetical protein
MAHDIMKWLLRLYPPEWRRRYGDEFAALMEQQRLSPGDMVDVVVAALDARLHPKVSAGEASFEGRFGMRHPARIAGTALILAAAAWAAWFLLLAFAPRGQAAVPQDPASAGAALGQSEMWALLRAAGIVAAVVLALAGLAGEWLQARQVGRPGSLAELSLGLVVVASAMVVVGYSVRAAQGGLVEDGSFPAIAVVGQIVFLLGVLLTGLAATGSAFLPWWSTVPLTVAPALVFIGFAGPAIHEAAQRAGADARMMVGVYLLLILVVLLGAAAAVRRQIPAWGIGLLVAAPLLLSFVYLAGATSSSEAPGWVIPTGSAMILSLSASWVLLGYALWQESSDGGKERPNESPSPRPYTEPAPQGW